VTELVYDSGALIAAERMDGRVWSLHRRALTRGVIPVVPVACLVEVTGVQIAPALVQLLAGCEVEPLLDLTARRAGELLRRVGTGSVNAVDATVVETALRHAATVVTTDRRDIERLAGGSGRSVAIIDV